MPPKNYQFCKYCNKWSSSIWKSYEWIRNDRVKYIKKLKQPISCKRARCAHCNKLFRSVIE